MIDQKKNSFNDLFTINNDTEIKEKRKAQIYHILYFFHETKQYIL